MPLTLKQLMRNILFILLFTSCAHFQAEKPDEIKDDVYAGNISVEAVQNLAFSSYLKGCTQTSKLSFEACKKLAKKHSDGIREILTNKK